MPPASMVRLVPASVSPFDAMNAMILSLQGKEPPRIR